MMKTQTLEGHMNPGTLWVLKNQLDCLAQLVASASPEELQQRPASGKWSAHQNLAHLLRHHEVMLGRIRRILAEDRPVLERYNAEQDVDWPGYSAMSTAEVVDRLRSRRAELLQLVEDLPPQQLNRVGLHTSMGAMPLSDWLQFFLLHESHHLYVAFMRVRGV